MPNKLCVFLLVGVLSSGCISRNAPKEEDRQAHRIVCMSSSHVAFLAELGAADRIVGISGTDFITNPDVRRRIEAGEIADVGFDSNLDFERLAALRPDLVLTYGTVPQRLAQMGVRCEFIGEYLEPTPLDRARWIVRVGELCGLEDVAKEHFIDIEQRYNRLKDSVLALSKNRPWVMLNAPYRDVWFVPSAENFMVRFIEDAGGECACFVTSSRESQPIDIEEAYLAMQSSDVWINVNSYNSLTALLADNQRFANTPPALNRRVYNNNNADFWESGVVRPDRVLRDLVAIFHNTGETLFYYKRLE